jgi:aminoglycoside phosphotransferase (APT) family kinase protein
MTPRRESLLRTIRRSAAMATARGGEPETLALLAVIDACANELELREQPGFWQRHLAHGMALAGLGAPESEPEGRSLDAALGDVARLLERQVEAVSGQRDTDASHRARTAADWELAIYAHRLTDGGGKGLPSSLFGRDAFEAYLKERWPEWKGLRVTHFAMAPGGFSKFTIMVTTTDEVNGEQALVLRVEPPVKFMELDGMDVRNEFPVVDFAWRAGLPVAQPLWLEGDEGKLGRRFFVSRRVAGSILGTAKGTDGAIPKDALRMLARTMARIHTTPLDPSSPAIRASHLSRWINYPGLRENSLGLVDYWAGQMRVNGVEGSPILAEAMAWLRANVPDEEAPFSLIHGDVGLHNMMVEDGRLTALLDWENSRIGDPAEDFAMLFAGIGDKIDRADFMAMYREEGGPAISDQRLDWFAVYGGFYVTVGALAVLARLDAHEEANVASAIFGLQFAHHYAASLPGLMAKAERDRR